MTIRIELLLVPECPHQAAAVALITTALRQTRLRATITSTTIKSTEQARQRGFIGSPTILLNDVDPSP